MTIHRFDAKRTLSIEKKCATDCRPDMIGCVIETSSNYLSSFNQQIQVSYRTIFSLSFIPFKSDLFLLIFNILKVCTYCCNKNYCNMNSAGTKEEAYNLGRTIIEAANSASSPNKLITYSFISLFLLLQAKLIR